MSLPWNPGPSVGKANLSSINAKHQAITWQTSICLVFGPKRQTELRGDIEWWRCKQRFQNWFHFQFNPGRSWYYFLCVCVLFSVRCIHLFFFVHVTFFTPSKLHHACQSILMFEETSKVTHNQDTRSRCGEIDLKCKGQQIPSARGLWTLRLLMHAPFQIKIPTVSLQHFMTSIVSFHNHSTHCLGTKKNRKKCFAFVCCRFAKTLRTGFEIFPRPWSHFKATLEYETIILASHMQRGKCSLKPMSDMLKEALKLSKATIFSKTYPFQFAES